jgi:formate hydrogenlyase subunit 3/multisubunit Na+/H+ antiporter MnhD subunit
MKMMKVMRHLCLTAAAFLVAAATGLAIPPGAAAQGCSLCYQSASAAGPRAIHALRNGILILMVPPAFICLGITYLVYRRRNLHNESADETTRA